MSSETARFKSIMEFSDLEDGKCRRIENEEHDLLLFREGNDVYCLLNRCSHMSKPMHNGRYQAGKINCPVHGAVFDVRTGAHLSPPAVRSVPCFEVRVVDGIIEVKI